MEKSSLFKVASVSKESSIEETTVTSHAFPVGSSSWKSFSGFNITVSQLMAVGFFSCNFFYQRLNLHETTPLLGLSSTGEEFKILPVNKKSLFHGIVQPSCEGEQLFISKFHKSKNAFKEMRRIQNYYPHVRKPALRHMDLRGNSQIGDRMQITEVQIHGTAHTYLLYQPL